MCFDWLDRDIASVASKKFFAYDDPLAGDVRKLIETSRLIVSPSYKQFVLKYGNASLYRKAGRYLVQVYAIPRDAEKDGRPLLCFGRTDESVAYFDRAQLLAAFEAPVFEWSHDKGFKRTHDDFAAWLIARCQRAKTRFSAKEWREIKQGPPPFTEAERRIVEARKQFKWKVVGMADDGDLLFEVSNHSAMNLPYLTLGVRSTGPELNGGIWLPVAEIRPGETRTVKRAVYKDQLKPTDVQLFDKEDPIPEDRDRYWEFKKTKT